jgi:transcriptional antiterminator RfaH
MMSHAIEDQLNWYVVHTHPKQEERTGSNLKAFGVETLMPKLRVNKYNEFTGHVSRIAKPLFPSYIFSRFRFNDLYHRLRYTRGVHSLICFNNKPTPIDDEIIELVRSRIGGDGFVKTGPDLKAGDEVVINDGRFQNLCGVFERELSDADRVRILLNTIGFQAHVVVNRTSVSKVAMDQHSSPQPPRVYSA